MRVYTSWAVMGLDDAHAGHEIDFINEAACRLVFFKEE